MSFFLNKIASLLSTLVVVGIVLFCSSAAQAHGNHGPVAPGTSVEVGADTVEVEAASDVGGDDGSQAVATKKDGAVGGHRVPGSSCCGAGMSNCMAAAVGTAVEPLQTPTLGGHGPARQSALLLGTVVDGLIRPPRSLV